MNYQTNSDGSRTYYRDLTELASSGTVYFYVHATDPSWNSSGGCTPGTYRISYRPYRWKLATAPSDAPFTHRIVSGTSVAEVEPGAFEPLDVSGAAQVEEENVERPARLNYAGVAKLIALQADGSWLASDSLTGEQYQLLVPAGLTPNTLYPGLEVNFWAERLEKYMDASDPDWFFRMCEDCD